MTTLWERLGVPQAIHATQDHVLNRRGNHPEHERKPRMLKIADPLNLESPNAAIAAAAEVKMEEDLAPQKIKALKYLGTIGCGCYDEDGKIEAAMLAGLADCTPAVRMAAIEAIQTSVMMCGQPQGVQPPGATPPRGIKRLVQAHQARRQGYVDCGGYGDCGYADCVSGHCGLFGHQGHGHLQRIRERRGDADLVPDCGGCGTCNFNACCTRAILARLKDMAYGIDEFGCFREPVASIRAAAAQALAMCPPLDEEIDPLPPTEPERVIPEGPPVPPVDRPPTMELRVEVFFGTRPLLSDAVLEVRMRDTIYVATRVDANVFEFSELPPGEYFLEGIGLSARRLPIFGERVIILDQSGTIRLSVSESVPQASLAPQPNVAASVPPTQPASSAAQPVSQHASFTLRDDLDERSEGGSTDGGMVIGYVQLFDTQRGTATIRLAGNYRFPEGAAVLVRDADGFEHEWAVATTEPGTFTATIVDGLVGRAMTEGARIRAGVLVD